MENNLNYLLSKKYDSTFSMNWIGTPDQFKTGNSLKLISDTTTGIKNFTSYNISTEGETENSYLKILFKYKNSSEECENWSDLIPIENISGISFLTESSFDLELHIFRVDDNMENQSPIIYLKNINLNGNYEYQITDSIAYLEPGNEIVLEPKDVYKVFSLEDFSIDGGNLLPGGYEIKYRFTQNNGRSFTEWEYLTTENLQTLRLSELRFASVQYLIKNTGTDSFFINDIILIGDFQNVSADYLKINRYGLREDCITMFQQNNVTGPNAFNKNAYTNGLSCYNGSDSAKSLQTNQDKSGYWNPYDADRIIELANLMGGHVSDIAGWTSTYCLADPDGNGTDEYLHEHQLKNIVDMQDVKIIIPENKFPNETIKITIWNLDLFDTFEVHIMKDIFKEQFGITKRPGQDDIIYICEVNRLFRVKHSQAFRDVMNASTYYKVVLEKYEDRKNVQFLDSDAEDLIKQLTNNTTQEEIFGKENKESEDKVANKKQTYTLSFDKLRTEKNNDIIYSQENLYQDNTIISKSHYNFKNITENDISINYSKLDTKLNKGENRSFISWFNFNCNYSSENYLSNDVFDSYNVTKNKVFPLLNNYDNEIGYRYWLEYDKVTFQINEKYYSLNYDFMTNIWYGLVINLNQKQRTINIDLYRRSYDIQITMFNKDSYEKITMVTENIIENSHELDNSAYTYIDAISDGFRPVMNNQDVVGVSTKDLIHESTITINEIMPVEFKHDNDLTLNGSNIKLTNIRIFDTIIKEESQGNLLKQYIIKDAQNLIMADNTEKQIVTTNYWNKNFK